MVSIALELFERLIHQVDQVEDMAQEADRSGKTGQSQIMRRSAFVLAVASIDTYFHEQAAALLYRAARRSVAEAGVVANYCRSVSASDVSGSAGASFIRMRLSYRTLVSPRNISAALAAGGVDEIAIWQHTAFALSTRPDRLHLQLDLLYDRRNQIAHEGDWDAVQFGFRPMERAHLIDCTQFLKNLAHAMDSHL